MLRECYIGVTANEWVFRYTVVIRKDWYVVWRPFVPPRFIIQHCQALRCGASAWFLDEVHGTQAICRVLSLPRPCPHRQAECNAIHHKERDQQAPPSDHVRDLRLDLIALALVRQRKVENRVHPSFRRPLELGVISANGVGGNGLANVLACGLVCDDEDKNEGGEREENGDKLENSEDCEAPQGLYSFVSTLFMT